MEKSHTSMETRHFISVAEARQIIEDHLPLLRAEKVPLAAALHRVLREDIHSREPLPPFANSAMDGYAVLLADVQQPPSTLRVTHTIAAGESTPPLIQPGCCVRIMTGAPVPPNAEAVVPKEHVEPEGPHVRILRTPAPGANIRHPGEDLPAGMLVLSSGRRITPYALGMLAALGYPTVTVSRRPGVVVITTGNELLDVADPLQPGKIRDSNGPTLSALATEAGAEVLACLRAPDRPEAIREALRDARHADVILLSGGISVGDYDFVREALADLSFELLFWKVRQRPGKPLAFGLLEGRPVFALPGNPVSSSLCFEMYVRPALKRMMGETPAYRPLFTARLAESLAKKPELHYFARGRAHTNEEGTLEVRPIGRQGSHMFYGLLEANCIIHLPEGQPSPSPGTTVQIEWLTS